MRPHPSSPLRDEVRSMRGHACSPCSRSSGHQGRDTANRPRRGATTMHERARAAYMARLGEVMREHVICEQQPLLHTYCIGKTRRI